MRRLAESPEAIGAKALVAFTQTGDTVRRLAALHCDLPLLAFTAEPEVRDQLALSWGVETFLMPFVQHTDDMFRQVDDGLLGLGRPSPATTWWSWRAARRAPPAPPTWRVHQLGSLVDAVGDRRVSTRAAGQAAVDRSWRSSTSRSAR